ncbi:MAG TPA: hypothetical protein VIJ35_14290 [Bradyrhizobium sp.]
MSRARARYTQSDVARAIRAAQQTGAGGVEVKPDGTISINLLSTATEDRPIDAKVKVVL